MNEIPDGWYDNRATRCREFWFNGHLTEFYTAQLLAVTEGCTLFGDLPDIPRGE